MKKVLIITYYWPPAGGPGVQRVLKFAKYLPQFGWKPLILTVKNGVYPAIDESLIEEIPADCKIYKSTSFEFEKLYRSFSGMPENEKIPIAVLSKPATSFKKRLLNYIRLNLFIPDAKILWMFSAVKLGKKIVKKEKPEIIFSSSPPPTAHLIASRLSKKFELKWIADFRDPWSQIHYYQNQRNPLTEYLDQRLELLVQNNCNLITCASKHFSNLLMTPDINKIQVIYNGYDEYDRTEYIKNEKQDRFKIIYVGGLNKNRYYPEFFKELYGLMDVGSINPKKSQVIFAGMMDNEIRHELENLFSPLGNFQYLSYVNHRKAISLMLEGDLLLLFQENVHGYEGHVPAKIFEYISTGNRILGIGNIKGDAAQILEESGLGLIYDPDANFSEIIYSIYNDWKNQKVLKVSKEFSEQYTRKFLTERLAQIFERINNGSA